MNQENIPSLPSTVSSAAASEVPAEQGLTPEDRKRLIILGITALLILGGLIAFFVYLAQPATETARIRDIFIIFMAIESLAVGVALIILIVQLATLINLLQNEIKPILQTTNETVNTLRGTLTFLSNNLVQPVIKMNEYLASFKRLLDLLRPGK
jgi:amino acid permease